MEDVLENEDLISDSSSSAPATDDAYHRHFIVAKDGILDSSDGRVVALKHPNNDQKALYYVVQSDEAIFEVLKVGRKQTGGSFFFGDSVIEDGSLTLLAPIHPLFLCIPYLIRSAKRGHLPLREILTDDEFPAIETLQGCGKLRKSLELAASKKEDGDETLYCHSREALLSWLEDRFFMLRESMLHHENPAAGLKENPDALSHYVFGVLCEYLHPEIHELLRVKLNIVEPEADNTSSAEGSAQGKKRRKFVDSNEKDSTNSKGAKRSTKAKKSTTELANASKGTKSLLGFFRGQ